MKGTHRFGIAAVIVLGLVFVAGVIHAGTTVPDVIKMETPAYEKRTKGIVEFSHKKHFTEYGATCGDCHHDENGQPLTDLKEGDDVQTCITCHKETVLDKADRKMPKEEKIAKYHNEAIHANCIGCHKEHNKENKLGRKDPKAAPTSCTQCHPRKKK